MSPGFAIIGQIREGPGENRSVVFCFGEHTDSVFMLVMLDQHNQESLRPIKHFELNLKYFLNLLTGIF